MKNLSIRHGKSSGNKSVLLLTVLALGTGFSSLSAQTNAASDQITAQPAADRIVPFRLSEQGVVRPVEWGLDTAWEDEGNIRRGQGFMETVDIVRVSFRPTDPIVDGDLGADQKEHIQTRLGLLGFVSPKPKLAINSDHPKIDDSYKGNAQAWAQMMDLHTRYFQDAGYEVISVAPFNEPDYTYTGQGTREDFHKIAVELRANPRFKNIRICGGNTLNCDEALPWYNYLKEQLDEGNTHQLAGEFNGYAAFYETVRKDGKMAMNDEMHNVMEAMVGLEYGLQTGIWWGSAEYARGEFCKISRGGERLAYTEHRPNWTAASVYRSKDGSKVQAFGGVSERQAKTTTYRFVSKEKDVFYDGYGPQREFYLEMPGGNSYQDDEQRNAERVVNITWGEDIQPVIDGQYVLINRSTQRAVEITQGNTAEGTNVKTGKFDASKAYQRWYVRPVSSRIGGDFSYFCITSPINGMSFDIWNWSLEDGGNIAIYGASNGSNQQWALEYAGDGWFYIRSRHSALYLEEGEEAFNVQQGTKKGSNDERLQWRLIPAPASKIEIKSLATPTGLTTEGQSASVLLKWNKQSDATEYTVLRSETSGGAYEIIARNVKETSFVDHKTLAGKSYYYTVKANDNCLNSSPKSQEVTATITDVHALVAHYTFDGDLLDETENLNHGASLKKAMFTDGKINKAVQLNGSTEFLQLPTDIANHQNLTVSTWVKWDGGADWQRVFDFGSGEDQYMFLTYSSNIQSLRFAMKNGAEEQALETALPSPIRIDNWVHLALTIGDAEVRIYVNGELAVSSGDITIRPMDIRPCLNYIGRSQFVADPMFKGSIDDFRVYNYELSAEDIKKVAQGGSVGIITPQISDDELFIGPLPADQKLQVTYTPAQSSGRVSLSIYNMQGVSVLSHETAGSGVTTLDVSGLPTGLYLLRLVDNNRSVTRKFAVRH